MCRFGGGLFTLALQKDVYWDGRTEAHTFRVLPRRWVVERTFGWLGRYRRRNRDYERQSPSSETMVYVAMIRLMLARLTKD